MLLKKLSIVLISFFFLGESAMASNLEKAKDAFNQFDINHLNLVEEFYDKDAVFQDPIHQLKGTKAIRSYYEGLYKNVEAIRFEFKNTSEAGDLVTLEWTMHLKTPVINSNNEFTVDGVSILTFKEQSGKVTFHRDYFDMGAFVYEKIPILGSMVRFIKKKMAGPVK